MPSGHTPLNSSSSYGEGVIYNAGKYKIYTRASYCEGFVNGAVRYDAYFPIMEYRNTDSTDSYPPNGTIQNVTERIYNESGTEVTYSNESQYRKRSIFYEYTGDSTKVVYRQKNYNTGTSGNPNDPDGWTFSFRFKLSNGQLDTGHKHIGIIQLTHTETDKTMWNWGEGLREISFGIGYNAHEDGSGDKYMFTLAGGIHLKIKDGDYPEIADNTWYHVVITRENSTTDPVFYINNVVYESHFNDNELQVISLESVDKDKN